MDNVNEYYKEMMLYLKLKSFHHCKWRLIKNGKKLFLQVSYYATLSSDLQNNLIYHITKIRTKIGIALNWGGCVEAGIFVIVGQNVNRHT